MEGATRAAGEGGASGRAGWLKAAGRQAAALQPSAEPLCPTLTTLAPTAPPKPSPAGELAQAADLLDRMHAGGMAGSAQLYHGVLQVGAGEGGLLADWWAVGSRCGAACERCLPSRTRGCCRELLHHHVLSDTCCCAAASAPAGLPGGWGGPAGAGGVSGHAGGRVGPASLCPALGRQQQQGGSSGSRGGAAAAGGQQQQSRRAAATAAAEQRQQQRRPGPPTATACRILLTQARPPLVRRSAPACGPPARRWR